MKSNILEIPQKNPALVLPGEVLTMKYFVNHLRKVRETASAHRQRFISFVIKKCEAYPEVEGPMDVAKIKDYGDLLQLLHVTTSPILEEENTQYWALATPVNPIIFYSTDALFNTMADEDTLRAKSNFATYATDEINNSHIESCYALILQRCYDIDSIFLQEMIYPFEAEANGLTRYFRIRFDHRFIEVFPNGPLPPFNIDANSYDKDQLLEVLQKKIPLNLFRFEGIAVMSVSEVTPQYAAENIKKILLNSADDHPENYFPEVVRSLKTLARSKDIEFGLSPLFKVNNKYILNRQAGVNSLLQQMIERKAANQEQAYSGAAAYLAAPEIIFIPDLSAYKNENIISADFLKANGIKAFAILPIYHNNSLCGMLEIYTRLDGLLTEDILPRVDPALPYIAQIFKKNIDDFENEIGSLIKQNFTSLQPAVQWRFNEAAWHYLRDSKESDNPQLEIENISFDEVFPLHGEVDIRNSTIERNAALQKDLYIQLNILIDVFIELQEKSGFGLIEEKIFLCRKWLERVTDPDGFNQENRINEFFESEIVPFFNDFRKGDPEYASIIQKYFDAVHEVDGLANENRRHLEQSMSVVISVVNGYMEKMKDEMQKAYPCYFEKFRTDGIEYDVYIGQSLAPEKPFSEIYLNNIRLMQLTSMAAITRHTHALLTELVKPVETTQLIYIHSHPIDIRFRKDEKRFDVEGAYNIRYQIIKKRIDKVNILGTKERLTTPDKIALVYFSPKEAEEYASYIQYLQEKGILNFDLEFLELEQLQGISGLKAMRVGVTLQ